MIRIIKNNINIPSGDKLNFIAINIFISMLGFVRSMVYMKFLEFQDLGIITIINTIIGLFGMMQLGFLNGGYRIFSVNNQRNNQETNNLIFTYFAILLSIALSTIGVMFLARVHLEYSYLLVIVGVIFGIITLCNNWLRNMLIALVKMKEINRANLFSSGISLIFLITVPYWGLKGAILTIISKPVFFLIFSLRNFKYLRPDRFIFSFAKSKWILSFGFIPFLTGIFNQFNLQIERWSIVYYLGTKSLGMFYLPTLYSTLFMLVPVSVNNLFFPPAMRTFVSGDFIKFKKILKNYYIFILIYITLCFLMTIFFLKPVIEYVFPEHVPAIRYIYAIFPGLSALLISRPLALLYNASVKLKPLFQAYLTSVAVMAILVYWLRHYDVFNLFNMALVKSVISIYILIYLFISYIFLKDNIWHVNKKLDKVNIVNDK